MRVESLSIIARWAGYEEYQHHTNPAYEKDIHAHFDKHANHPLIAFAHNIRQPHAIIHDAVMSMSDVYPLTNYPVSFRTSQQ